MSRFVTAMDSTVPTPLPLNKQVGENLSPEYTADGVEDPRVALFFALVRGMDRTRLTGMLDTLLATERADLVADAMVLAFQTRNCRGGKGELDLFYWMILDLYKLYPKTVTEMLKLVPQYGSYKDWFQLVSLAEDNDKGLMDAILTIAAEQLLKDREAMSSNKGFLSLLAKWAPRAKRANGKQAGALAKKLFSGSKTANKEYRQLVASLNKALRTTEVNMCVNRWDRIEFGSVPSLAMLKYRKAFLNEQVGTVPTMAEDETGNRFPENEVRVACRKRLRKEIIEQKVSKLKGKQLFPHEIVNKFQNTQTSTLEADLLQHQWNDIRENVKMSMSKGHKAEGSGRTVDLEKLVAIADVSGSMTGTPMKVSIALSILVSELAAPEFADRFLTFSESPEWVKFEDGMSLKDKIQTTARAPWGMNTDFAKAMDLLLDTAVAAKLKPCEIPGLIVFSDMQFDQARSTNHYYDSPKKEENWETQLERLVREYKEAGLKACGEPWAPPHVIYWNLRGDTSGFPAQADMEGVTMLSGFSPSLVKLLLSGEEIEAEETVKEVINEDGDVVLVKERVKKNPYDTLRAALDYAEYDKVREIIGRSEEGLLVEYEFEPQIGGCG